MRLKYSLLAALAAAAMGGEARAQSEPPTSCVADSNGNWQANGNRVFLGTAPCTAARGDALAAEIARALAAEGAAGAAALPKAGGTMTGPLVLSGAPTAPLNPATKAYSDAETTRAQTAEGANATAAAAAQATANAAAPQSALTSEASTARAAEGANATAAAAAQAKANTALQPATVTGLVKSNGSAFGAAAGADIAAAGGLSASAAGAANGIAQLGPDGKVLGAQLGGSAGVTTNVTATPYTVAATDSDICVSVNAPATITLPATATQIYTVKDCADHAATYPITIQIAGGALIDGYTNVIMTQNAMSLDFKYSGTSWGLR
jgi:hypothetical protein